MDELIVRLRIEEDNRKVEKRNNKKENLPISPTF